MAEATVSGLIPGITSEPQNFLGWRTMRVNVVHETEQVRVNFYFDALPSSSHEVDNLAEWYSDRGFENRFLGSQDPELQAFGGKGGKPPEPMTPSAPRTCSVLTPKGGWNIVDAWILRVPTPPTTKPCGNCVTACWKSPKPASARPSRAPPSAAASSGSN